MRLPCRPPQAFNDIPCACLTRRVRAMSLPGPPYPSSEPGKRICHGVTLMVHSSPSVPWRWRPVLCLGGADGPRWAAAFQSRRSALGGTIQATATCNLIAASPATEMTMATGPDVQTKRVNGVVNGAAANAAVYARTDDIKSRLVTSD